MAYTITLSANEYDAMDFFTWRGYFPKSIMVEAKETWTEDEQEVTLTIPEHIAWDLSEMRENDSEALYTCMDDILREKWEAFEMSVV